MTLTAMLRVEKLDLSGHGVAGSFRIARALPGELVEGVISAGRMANPIIREASPDRVEPNCPHYGACGGCTLMHATDPFVAEWKASVVRKALAARGLSAPFAPVAISPPQSRRRAVFAAQRRQDGAVVGFHARASTEIVPIPECRLLEPRLVELRKALGALIAIGASRNAGLDVSVTALEPGADVAVTGSPCPTGRRIEALASWAAQAGVARLSWEGETLFQSAAPWTEFGRARVYPPPGAFLQATRHGEAALSGAVLYALRGVRRAADLFAGCGTFTLRLAEQARVHAVERDQRHLAALAEAARRTPALKPVATEARDLHKRPFLAAELKGFDAVVIDPPRAGAEAQAKELALARVPVVAMVSCNPVTFARDAAILVSAGYRLDWVQVVDQFRWSTHVELAARLALSHLPAQPPPGVEA